MSERIRILGIDPGSRITGYGVIDWFATQARPVTWGHVQTDGAHSSRLKTIFEAINGIVCQYDPEEIAIERVFLHRNADSALKLGQARAAAICATFQQGPEIFEYSARHIKKALVGRGAAEKNQVAQMVRMLLGIRDDLQGDAADALAVAVCHAHQRNTQQRVDETAVHL
jgi:crossover junction endodeoxyribonuclease RuvC